jgi:hypothetical protein
LLGTVILTNFFWIYFFIFGLNLKKFQEIVYYLRFFHLSQNYSLMFNEKMVMVFKLSCSSKYQISWKVLVLVVLRETTKTIYFFNKLYRSTNSRLFFKNAWHFKDIFREIEAYWKWFEAFLKISNLFEDIFREIEAFFKVILAFSKNSRLF